MKSQVFNFISMFLIVLFVGCNGSKTVAYELQKEAPFKIIKAEYKDWIGGIEGVRGISIEIVIDNEEVAIDTLYFRGNKIIPSLKTLNKTELQITGRIVNKSKTELILHKNPQQEFGNVAPVKDVSFPFELLKNEVVLQFTQKDKINYLKIELLKGETQVFQ